MSVQLMRRTYLAKSEEAKSRFQSVLLHVLMVLSRRRMIILFLDDIQWSDQCSIDALRKIVETTGIGHVVVACSYRDDDMNPSIQEKIASIHDTAGPRLAKIAVDALSSDDVLQFTARVFDMTPAQPKVVGLSDLLFQVTSGNPYYFRQLLTDFHRAS